MSVREEPVGGFPLHVGAPSGSCPAGGRSSAFNLVGLHWRGAGKVYFRTAGVRGWSPWRFARPEADDLPDLRSAEAERARGWKLGNPFWTGKANRIQYRLVGEVDRLRSYLVRSTVSSTPRTVARATRPPIVLRSGWGADETIVRSAPWYANRIGFAVVHHTAGAQPSTPAQSAAIVRANPALPRARERLERHRLQLPGRPVRPGVRGPRGWDRAERGRGARSGLQHRKRGGGCPRHVFLSRNRAARKGRTRCSACLAA